MKFNGWFTSVSLTIALAVLRTASASSSLSTGDCWLAYHLLFMGHDDRLVLDLLYPIELDPVHLLTGMGADDPTVALNVHERDTPSYRRGISESR